MSGRSKALIVDGSGHGYLRTVSDYVHLNPARAGWLGPQERLLGYPWTSLGAYLSAPKHRPEWIRVDRLMGEHGIQADTVAGRREFEQGTERLRAEDAQGERWAEIRRGWRLGGEEFKKEMLLRMEGQLGENHSGELRRESAEARAERIIGEELGRLGWTAADLAVLRKGDPGKLALAARRRRETTLSVRWIAERLQLGSRKSASARLHVWRKVNRV